MSRTSRQYYRHHIADGLWDTTPEWDHYNTNRNRHMDINSAFPSNYVKSSDIGTNRVPLVMDRVVIETLKSERGDEKKPVLYFMDRQKGLVLNTTNANTIQAAYTNQTDAWRGKPVILYVTQVQFGGRMVDGLRIEIPAGVAPQQSELDPPPMTDAEIAAAPDPDDDIPW